MNNLQHLRNKKGPTRAVGTNLKKIYILQIRARDGSRRELVQACVHAGEGFEVWACVDTPF